MGTNGWIVAVTVLVAATGLGLLRRSRQGRLRAVRPAAVPAVPAGTAAGPRPVSLLLFTTPTCTTCRRVRAVCAGLDGVELVEIDATVDVDRARDLDVWRAPTLFVLDPTGRPAWRTTGVPRAADLAGAVRAAAPPVAP